MTLLKRDSEIKRAIASALRRDWSEPAERDPADERRALREMCLEDTTIAEGTGLPTTPAVRDAVRETPNYFLCEVFVFCPVALPNWQKRARIVLGEQVAHWRTELARAKAELTDVGMCAVPFGRFLRENEGPQQWVSELEAARIRPSELFDTVEGVHLNTEQEVWYYRRPFILWPVRSGTLTHITRAAGREYMIKRTPLYDWRLEQGEPSPPKPALPEVPELPLWRRRLRRLVAGFRAG